MKVEIKSIKDPGVLEKERLVLKVLHDCDIGYFLVCDSTYTGDGQLSNLIRHPFWFPDKEVNTGDLVILYTKKGKRSQLTNQNGSVSHFFYWGMESTIWNKKEDCAVILEISDWSSVGYS